MVRECLARGVKTNGIARRGDVRDRFNSFIVCENSVGVYAFILQCVYGYVYVKVSVRVSVSERKG